MGTENLSKNDIDNCTNNFLEMLRYALCDDSKQTLPNLVKPVNWEVLEKMFLKHNLFSMFHEVASLFPEYKVQERYQDNVRRAMITIGQQIKRTDNFLNVYQELLQQGIQPIVMKGIICRQLYGTYAEKRVSGDEDIYVRKEDFFRVKSILEKQGYICEFEELTAAQLTTMQHIIFFGENSRELLEVHVNPMGHRNEMRSQMNDYFKDSFSRMRVQIIKGVSVYTFSHTEHFLFLIMHTVKHFVEGGVGIRQMLDILLYQKYYEDEIDWAVARTALRDIHAEGFLGDIQWLGKQYLGFDFKETFQETCPNILLMDTMHAGVFGKKERDDTVATSITMEVMNHKKRGIYAWFRAGFPSRKLMVDAYPYLQEKPWLLPVEWVKRWGRFIRKSSMHDGNLMLDGLKKSRKRMKMLKKYGL